MTHDEQTIKFAADYIYDECEKLGSPITHTASVKMATELFKIWSERFAVRNQECPECEARLADDL